MQVEKKNLEIFLGVHARIHLAIMGIFSKIAQQKQPKQKIWTPTYV